jgi:hypothetical protein
MRNRPPGVIIIIIIITYENYLCMEGIGRYTENWNPVLVPPLAERSNDPVALKEHKGFDIVPTTVTAIYIYIYICRYEINMDIKSKG